VQVVILGSDKKKTKTIRGCLIVIVSVHPSSNNKETTGKSLNFANVYGTRNIYFKHALKSVALYLFLLNNFNSVVFGSLNKYHD